MPEIFCGGVQRTPKNADDVLQLDVHGASPNIELKIQDIKDTLMSNVPPVLLDLLEVASYVYCADQRTPRGDQYLGGMGKHWHKPMNFVIPVRQPDTWNGPDVQKALKDCLRFLSDHSYEFEFVQGANDLNTPQDYLDLWTGENTAGFAPDDICLFSGGLDSFSGAVEDLVANNKSLVLVGHYSASKVFSTQKSLIDTLRQRGLSRQIFYTPVRIHNKNVNDTEDSKKVGEFTQRTRSFIFAALAITIAQLYKKDKITFYENGVVSLNLPLAQDILGARSTRTTHPKVIRGFENIFSLLLDKEIVINHPFQWMTKNQVTALLDKNGFADMIGQTNSCTKTRLRQSGKTHCGVCSQCIDRRFGVLASGLGAHDPQDLYECDLLLGNRGTSDDVAMAVNYVKFAQEFSEMSITQMARQYPQIFDALDDYRDADAMNKLFNMMKSHAQDVTSIISAAAKEHSDDLTKGRLPEKCLLSMSVTGAKVVPLMPEGRDTTDDVKNFMDRLSVQPCEFAVDESKKNIVFSGGLTLSATEYSLVKILLPPFIEAKGLRAVPAPVNTQTLAQKVFRGNEVSLRKAIERINKKVSENLGVDMGVVMEDGFIKNVRGQGYKINRTAKLLASVGDLLPAAEEAVTQ